MFQIKLDDFNHKIISVKLSDEFIKEAYKQLLDKSNMGHISIYQDLSEEEVKLLKMATRITIHIGWD